MRRDLQSDAQQFPNDVVELQHYFAPVEPGQTLRAVPGAGLEVPLWILGSSTFGAQLAAELGLPYAFASHFAPGELMNAIAIYRARFKPSKQLAKPYVMLGFNVFAADTDAAGQFLFSSLQQAFVNLRSGRPALLQAPVDGFAERLHPGDRAMIDSALSCCAVGSPGTVRRALQAFIDKTGADELMLTSQIFDHTARMRSYEIAAEVREQPVTA